MNEWMDGQMDGRMDKKISGPDWISKLSGMMGRTKSATFPYTFINLTLRSPSLGINVEKKGFTTGEENEDVASGC